MLSLSAQYYKFNLNENEKNDILTKQVHELEIQKDRLRRQLQQSKLTRKNITYGHIHMAKTAGTTLNGMLALNFERVCGHKGYSFDYYQVNKRFNNTNWRKIKDVHTVNKHGNRGWIHGDIMNDIGYEDCDWISHQVPWAWWKRFKNWPTDFELHLPCRQPLDHLMSQCNYKRLQFNCDTTDLKNEIDRCISTIGRFSRKLVDGDTLPNGNVKCYNVKFQFTKYMELMSEYLQSKRIVDEYVHRSTNDKRNKSDECIWEASMEFKDEVTAHLSKTMTTTLFVTVVLGQEMIYLPKRSTDLFLLLVH